MLVEVAGSCFHGRDSAQVCESAQLDSLQTSLTPPKRACHGLRDFPEQLIPARVP